MNDLRYRLVFLMMAAMLAAAPARALVVFNYNATANERFASGFPGAPVANANPGFIGAGLDFSGVGWRTASSGTAVTLIAPQYFVTAAHVAPGAGTTVSFLNQNGVVKTYTVNSTYTVLHSAGVNTDIVLGRLDAPIDAGDLITSYSTLLLNSYSDYLGLPVLAYGASGRVGTNNIDGLFVNFDMLPFGGGNTVPDSVLLATQYNSGNANETQGAGGDSGSPTFINLNGTLALLGVHSAIATSGSPPPDLTLDSFLPSYYAQIDSRLGLDGFSFGAFVAVPEPAAVALLLGLGALAFAVRRKAA